MVIRLAASRDIFVDELNTLSLEDEMVLVHGDHHSPARMHAKSKRDVKH